MLCIPLSFPESAPFRMDCLTVGFDWQEGQKSQGQEAVDSLVGVVMPSDAHPGQQVSGTMVKDPKRYEGITCLEVSRCKCHSTVLTMVK